MSRSLAQIVALQADEVASLMPLGRTFDGFVEIMTGRMGDRDSKEEIAKVFALFDHEGNGKISFRDLKRVVTELGENIPDEEMREMIEEADKDQDGFVIFDDFYKILKKTDDGA